MNKLYLLFLLLLYQFSLRAQVAIQWQNTIGGNYNDKLYSSIQTADGGYILGGSSISDISSDKTENCLGDFDYWVIKLDSAGNIQWQNTIGGDASDHLYSIFQTMDGGYVCGGYSNSNISWDKTENSQGSYDYWVVKLDQAGVIQWQNTIGGSDHDFLYSITQTSDGGYICGGISHSNISGDKTENSQGDEDFWVIKLDAAGNIQWQNTIGAFSSDYLSSIIQTSDGGYICGGESLSGISGDKTENNIGSSDYWVVKLDQTGVIQWQNTIGGNGGDVLYSIEQTMDGGYVCGGHSNSNISGDKTENSQGLIDYWVVKLDSTGIIQWQNTIGGNNHDLFDAIIQTTDSGYICGGRSPSNISGDKTENSQGLTDYWVVKLDSTGIIQWQNTIGGNGGDELYSIEQTVDGNYLCGGWSYSNISGDKTENMQGDEDYWIVKLTENFNSIQGKTFVDLNSNNLYDTGEPPLQGIIVSESQTGAYGISESNGNYTVAVMDSGNFTVFPIFLLPYYTATPIAHNVYFSSMQQTDSLNDFAFQPTGVFNDLQISITPLSPFRPGFNTHYNLHYKNVGTTSLTGTVIFYPDSAVTYVSSSVVPFLVSADSVLWQTPLLNPFDESDLLVTVNVNSGTPIGAFVNSCIKIIPIPGDATPVNNETCWEVIVTGSVDPNDILVNRSTITTTELVSPPYLEYIIRFQNTGTDTAFTIKVLNPIDTSKLQLNTFELVSSSHSSITTWKAWERNMEFNFDYILLPDSNINEPLSHGFIRYRIKPKATLVAADLINNNAYIYFDFNNPVATNTAITEIILPTSVSSFADVFDFRMFPNPTSGEITITQIGYSSAAEFILYDLTGRIILTHLLKGTSTIDISHFNSALYFYEVRSDRDEKAFGKLVKQ